MAVALRNLMMVLREVEAGATARPDVQGTSFHLRQRARERNPAIDREFGRPACSSTEHLVAAALIQQIVLSRRCISVHRRMTSCL